LSLGLVTTRDPVAAVVVVESTDEPVPAVTAVAAVVVVTLVAAVTALPVVVEVELLADEPPRLVDAPSSSLLHPATSRARLTHTAGAIESRFIGRETNAAATAAGQRADVDPSA
jgi:hypothetical protein